MNSGFVYGASTPHPFVLLDNSNNACRTRRPHWYVKVCVRCTDAPYSLFGNKGSRHLEILLYEKLLHCISYQELIALFIEAITVIVTTDIGFLIG